MPTQKYFNAVASRWDQMRVGYFGEEVRQAALLHACLEPNQVAADLGCGTGYILEALAPLVSKAYGMDASAGMLEEARDKITAAGFKRAELIMGRIDELPLADSSLDCAFSNMVLHHLPAPLTALAEVFRVLRPGGRYIVTDLEEHQFSWLREEMQDVWMGFPRPRILEWLREAGFVEVGIDCVAGSCCATSAERGKAQIGIFVAWGQKPR